MKVGDRRYIKIRMEAQSLYDACLLAYYAADEADRRHHHQMAEEALYQLREKLKENKL
jgi:hypothetical protein